jgi:hypothetical protein
MMTDNVATKTPNRRWPRPVAGALALVVAATAAYLFTGPSRHHDNSWRTAPDTEFLALFQGPPDTLASYLKPFHQDEEFRETFPQDVAPPRMDTTLDLTRFSLEQIRYLRHFVLARHGFLFRDMVLRAFFNRFKWYQPIWNPADFSPRLAPWEQRWHDKLKEREDQLAEGMWIESDGIRRASIGHLVNRMVFDSLPTDLVAHLDTAGFAVVEGRHRQLWNVYDKNQYDGIPSIVTPDLYLQLLHMRFKYLMKDMEREHLVGQLDSSLRELRSQLDRETEPELREGAQKAQAAIALAQAFLTGSDTSLAALPGPLRVAARSDFADGIAGEGFSSVVLLDTLFDWSRLKPRGHYASSDTLGGYFRALKWLGLARWKLTPEHLPAALALARAWAACGALGPEGIHRIAAFADALSGPRNGLSPQDLAEELNGQNPSQVFGDAKMRDDMLGRLQGKDPSRFHARGGNAIAVADLAEPSMRVFPMRWSGDAEILQRLIELERRPFPSGLDVFTVRGVEIARQILVDELKVPQTWSGWTDSVDVLRKTPELFQGVDFHSRRMDLAGALFRIPSKAPPFQQTPLWQRHVLVTGLAGWTLQKQENILYQEQAEAAECGEGGGPPPPDPMGWVDPNVEFWEGAAKLVQAVDSLVHALAPDAPSDGIDKDLLEDFTWLADASRRELAGQPLTPDQLRNILWIGGRAEELTYRITRLQPWNFDKTDEGMSAAAVDVYSKNGTPLMEGTGYADELWALVEIGGHLHLGRGAVFSHREWIGTERLTDRKWHDMLEARKGPDRPQWQAPLFSSSTPPTTVPSTAGLLPSGSCY